MKNLQPLVYFLNCGLFLLSTLFSFSGIAASAQTTPSEKKQTQLFDTVRFGSLGTASLLIEREFAGSDLNFVDQSGLGLVAAAVSTGNTEMVRFLLSIKRLDPNTGISFFGGRDMTGLLRDGKIEVVKLLIGDFRVDFQNRAENDSTIIEHSIATHGDLELVKMAFSDSRFDINAKKHNQFSVIDAAGGNSNPEVIEYLLSHSDYRPPGPFEFKPAPLNVAVRTRGVEVIKRYLNDPRFEQGPDNFNGRPLSWSVIDTAFSPIVISFFLDNTDWDFVEVLRENKKYIPTHLLFAQTAFYLTLLSSNRSREEKLELIQLLKPPLELQIAETEAGLSKILEKHGGLGSFPLVTDNMVKLESLQESIKEFEREGESEGLTPSWK